MRIGIRSKFNIKFNINIESYSICGSKNFEASQNLTQFQMRQTLRRETMKEFEKSRLRACAQELEWETVDFFSIFFPTFLFFFNDRLSHWSAQDVCTFHCRHLALWLLASTCCHCASMWEAHQKRPITSTPCKYRKIGAHVSIPQSSQLEKNDILALL